MKRGINSRGEEWVKVSATHLVVTAVPDEIARQYTYGPCEFTTTHDLDTPWLTFSECWERPWRHLLVYFPAFVGEGI